MSVSSPVTSNDWPWPDSLDALVAAPEYHKLLMEDDRVRVIHTRVPPGETVPLHTHCWPSLLVILGWSECVRRDEKGEVTYDARKAGPPPSPDSATWYPPLPPHTLENVGTAEISTINVEFKGDFPRNSTVFNRVFT
jgi:mannose-6-phosphate isomerase-like protein (cupin superfamily)